MWTETQEDYSIKPYLRWVLVPEKLLRDEERVTPAGIVTTQTVLMTDEKLWGHEGAPKKEAKERELAECVV